eukprot:1162117-Pelagomonas_calceolata.AAC.10
MKSVSGWAPDAATAAISCAARAGVRCWKCRSWRRRARVKSRSEAVVLRTEAAVLVRLLASARGAAVDGAESASAAALAAAAGVLSVSSSGKAVASSKLPSLLRCPLLLSPSEPCPPLLLTRICRRRTSRRYLVQDHRKRTRDGVSMPGSWAMAADTY